MHTLGAKPMPTAPAFPHICQNEFPSPRSLHGHVGKPPSSTLSTTTDLDKIWSSPELLEQYEKARWAGIVINQPTLLAHPSLPNPNADRALRPAHTLT